MGNCSNFDNELQDFYAEFRSCAPDSDKTGPILTQPRIPESYPKSFPKKARIFATILKEKSEEFDEDPYLRSLQKNDRKIAEIREIREIRENREIREIRKIQENREIRQNLEIPENRKPQKTREIQEISEEFPEEIPEEIEQKLLDFKMLSVRGSKPSSISETFLQDNTKSNNSLENAAEMASLVSESNAETLNLDAMVCS